MLLWTGTAEPNSISLNKAAGELEPSLLDRTGCSGANFFHLVVFGQGGDDGNGVGKMKKRTRAWLINIEVAIWYAVSCQLFWSHSAKMTVNIWRWWWSIGFLGFRTQWRWRVLRVCVWTIALTFSGFPKSAALIIAVRTCCCSRFAFFVEIVEVPLIMLLVKGGDLHSFHPKRLNSSQESWLSWWLWSWWNWL